MPSTLLTVMLSENSALDDHVDYTVDNQVHCSVADQCGGVSKVSVDNESPAWHRGSFVGLHLVSLYALQHMHLLSGSSTQHYCSPW